MSTRSQPPRVQDLVAELQRAAGNPAVFFAGFDEVLLQLGAHLQAQAALVTDLQRRVAELERRR